MIPESYYVNVNVAYKQGITLASSVPLSVLVSKTATSTKKYASLQQVESDYTLGTEPELKAAQLYFNNGGKELLIYQQDNAVSDANTISALLSAVQEGTYNDFIWLTFVEAKTVEEIGTILSTLKGATTKLPKFLAQTTGTAGATSDLLADGHTNAALLYSTEGTVTPYSAIVIPAYFSGVNLQESNSLKSIVHSVLTGATAASITTTELTTLYEANWNVIVNLGNRYTILDGGKMINGEPIHSAWGFAVFKSDCEDAITDLLIRKLPYNNNSNAIIENALSSICSSYARNGLISSSAVYNQDTVIVNYNSVNYTVIESGQALNSGYYIYSIPIGNAMESDKVISKTPPIYIYAIINDVIRMVEINGEVSK